ncbi:MAG: TPM domain-containing protein [Deltaproteobacteria bacterium]|nr:TPM domain-containing protein [Deltaproteobacteria bacterium]
MQSSDEQIKAASAEVVYQYQRRSDLVLNLVNVVKDYAAHEKEVLENVTAEQQYIPRLRARVTDNTGTLSGSEKSQLESVISKLEQSKGSQIAVLIVPTTQPEAIEQYSMRLAESWKLGRRGVDDGVILLVAKGDRKLRIEVGYGLEGALNDATCKRIIDELITPHFKQGKFFDGINSGVESIIKVINNEPLPEPVFDKAGSITATQSLAPATYAKANIDSSEDLSESLLVIVVCIILAVFIYFLPTHIAFRRGHPNRWPIFVINLIFGISGIFWIICLIWALCSSGSVRESVNLTINNVCVDNNAPFDSYSDIVMELEKLQNLKEKGILKEEEFIREKTGLLNALKKK